VTYRGGAVVAGAVEDGGGVCAVGAGVTSSGCRVVDEPRVFRPVRVPLELWPVAYPGLVVVPFVPDLFVLERLDLFLVPGEFVRPGLEVLFGELVVLSGDVVVGEVGSVGLPAVPAGGVTGEVESFGVAGVGTVEGGFIGGVVVVPGLVVPGGNVVPGAVGAVEGFVLPPVGEEGEVAGAVEPVVPAPREVCAIAAPANIADTTSDSNRVDLSEMLVMKGPHQGKFPCLWDGR
jgi:hypothetical protein